VAGFWLDFAGCSRIDLTRGSLAGMATDWAGPGWKFLASEELFSSQWFTVRRDDALRPDGSQTCYDHVVAPPAVTVLAVDADGLVAVTRQWIYTHAGTQWRLPAGRMDDGDESPEVAGRRELAEETGIAADEWVSLGVVNGADSLSNHRDHAFVATGLRDLGETRLEPGESDLKLHWVPAARLVEMVLDGKLPHAGSTFAVLAAKVKGLI
jgi:8-oxo-dGTP pyrophosphatase MutT (NUDIX family)